MYGCVQKQLAWKLATPAFAAAFGCAAPPTASGPVAPEAPVSEGTAAPASPPSAEAATSPASEDPEEDTSDGDPLVGFDGLAIDDAVSPLQPQKLEGPFESIDVFIAGRDPDVDEGCTAPTGKPSVAAKTLSAKDGAFEVRLFRLKTGDSCEPTEHCFISLRNDAGWWVGERLCAGRLDAERQLSTSDTALRWVKLRGSDAAAVEYTVSLRTAKPATKLELRWLRLCGVGSAGASCTRPTLLACLDEDGTKESANADFKNGQLVLTSSAPKDACDDNEAFLVGTFDVSFP